MIRLIIFDLDGTLVNAYPAVVSSVNFTLKKCGFPPKTPNQIKRAVGWGDRQLMVQFVGEKLADQALEYYRPHHLKALKGGSRFLPGAHSLLKELNKKGVMLAIASNRPLMFTEVILKGLKADHFFDYVLCADKAKKPKPYPDMLQAICRKFKISKNETLFVGDMTIDLNCGANAGIKTVAVTTGSNTKKELNDLGPYKIINRINQIKKFI